jgi:hypothetical protein
MITRPLFSILHPTIRFPGWQEAWRTWINRADNPENLEYLLVIDQEDEGKLQLFFSSTYIIVNYGRSCYVDAQNCAARVAAGAWLITAADDWFPCDHWDSMLRDLVPDPLRTEAVVKVQASPPHCPGLIIYPILTRAYYARPGRGGCPNGELFYPEYLSMGSDDDLTEYATRDGVVIDAPHMEFEHRHPSIGLSEMDDQYKHVQSPESWQVKERVIERRRRENYAR